MCKTFNKQKEASDPCAYNYYMIVFVVCFAPFLPSCFSVIAMKIALATHVTY